MRSAFVSLLSAALLTAGIVAVRQSARMAGYERRHEEDLRELRQLRAAVAQGPPRPETATAQPIEVRPPSPPPRPDAGNGGDLAARDSAIQQLKSELADGQDTIARLHAQLQEAGQVKQQALSSAESLQKREHEWRDQIDLLKQELDSARAELQAARERTAGMEADNAKLKSESGAGGTRAAELRKDLTTLQDLDRRREGYLSSVARRYREVTEQFRVVTGTLDSSRAESASPSGIALSRIQNAISLAEDDLRRLNELNAQARQIETRLARN